MRILAALWRDETAATTVEMALMVAMGAMAAIAVWQHLADTVQNQAYEVNDLLESTHSR